MTAFLAPSPLRTMAAEIQGLAVQARHHEEGVE
jgi:hypothetical protein